MTLNKKILVIGAGPAGLSASYKLIDSGASVTVLESEPVVGGLCSSFTHDRCIFDYGGHRLYSEDPSILALLDEICGDELKLRSRRSSIYLDGKFIKYPLRFTNLLYNMKFKTVVYAVFEYIVRYFKRIAYKKPENNLEDWIRNRFGNVLFEIYFKPYTEKFWGVPVNDIAVDWASKRITLSGFWEVMTRLFGRRTNLPVTYIDEFFYPDKGIGRVFELMAERLNEKGAEILNSTEINEIKCSRGKIESVVYSRNNKSFILNPDAVISTIPLPSLLALIKPPPGSKVMASAKELRFRSLIFVFIVTDRNNITEDNWIYFPEKKYVFNRIIEPGNWSEDMVPEDLSSLCVEISCNSRDKIWYDRDSSIFDNVIEDLEKIGLLKKEEVSSYLIKRKEFCYPLYSTNYKTNLDSVKDYIAEIHNLCLAGRGGRFNYDNTVEAIASGLEAASFLLTDTAG